jgi:hypothetical protein
MVTGPPFLFAFRGVFVQCRGRWCCRLGFQCFFLGWLAFDRVVDLRCWWIRRSGLRYIGLNGRRWRAVFRYLNLRFWCWRLHIFGILCSFDSVDVGRRFAGFIFLRSTIFHNYYSWFRRRFFLRRDGFNNSDWLSRSIGLRGSILSFTFQIVGLRFWNGIGCDLCLFNVFYGDCSVITGFRGNKRRRCLDDRLFWVIVHFFGLDIRRLIFLRWLRFIRR